MKEYILQLHFKPGLSISEKFNISRTPVREAFLFLSQEGLLDIYPQKGTFVSLIDLDAVEEARFFRKHMEKVVVRNACKQFPKKKLTAFEMNLKMQKSYLENKDFVKVFEFDEEFHKTIFEGCSKVRTWNTICQVEVNFQRICILTLVSNLNVDHIYFQHKIIIDAIKNRKNDEVDKIMKNHLTMINYDLNDVEKK